MDDIWGGYYAQSIIGFDKVIYNRASVYQDRNIQDLITNLEKEVIGYRHTFDFSQNFNIHASYIPEQTKQFLKIYFNNFK
jgi:hypothetical protein